MNIAHNNKYLYKETKSSQVPLKKFLMIFTIILITLYTIYNTFIIEISSNININNYIKHLLNIKCVTVVL